MAKPEPHFPANPPGAAVEYLKSKGLKESEHWTEVWREEHATSFTVARSAGYDILGDLQDGLVKMLREGQTLRQFQKDMKPILQAKGWWGVLEDASGSRVQLGSPRRLKVIYEANIRTARAAGQWQRIQERVESHPFLLYQLGPSVRHRAEHVRWNGFIARVDDPFWDAHFPPNGWGCKCFVRQIDARKAEQLLGTGQYSDYRTRSPRVEYRDWVNKTTGKTERVPVGIDPGWDTNPGKVRWGGAVKALVQKSEKVGVATDLKPSVTLYGLLGWIKQIFRSATSR